MFSPIFDRTALFLSALAITACGGPNENQSDKVRVECAIAGAATFKRDCTLARMASSDGTVLVVGREGAGYRRLLVTTDGRGVVAADGAEPASVTIIGDGQIEVAVGGDLFRLPADTDGLP